MGLGNHKRKMSISLSITLIFPHTVANLVQARSRERQVDNSLWHASRYSQSPCPERCEGFHVKCPRDRQRYTLNFLSVYFTGLNVFFSVIWRPGEVLDFVHFCQKCVLTFTYVFIPCRRLVLQASPSLNCIFAGHTGALNNVWFDTVIFLLNLFDHILRYSSLMPRFIASHAQRFKANPRNCSCLMQIHMGSFFFCLSECIGMNHLRSSRLLIEFLSSH